jgi:hypothetical protein
MGQPVRWSCAGGRLPRTRGQHPERTAPRHDAPYQQPPTPTSAIIGAFRRTPQAHADRYTLVSQTSVDGIEQAGESSTLPYRRHGTGSLGAWKEKRIERRGPQSMDGGQGEEQDHDRGQQRHDEDQGKGHGPHHSQVASRRQAVRRQIDHQATVYCFRCSSLSDLHDIVPIVPALLWCLSATRQRRSSALEQGLAPPLVTSAADTSRAVWVRC